MPNPANPQSWNRYAYVNNSPVNYNDPSGHYAQYDDRGVSLDEPCKDKNGQSIPCYVYPEGYEKEGDVIPTSRGDGNDGALKDALEGDPWAILDLIIPTHAGFRVQGEATFAPPWLPPWLGISITIPGINVMYHRPDNDLTLFMDVGGSGGPGYTGGKLGIGVSATGGAIFGWGSSESKQISDGWASNFTVAAHAEESFAATVSSNMKKDRRYGILPTTFYVETGTGCCYAGAAGGASVAKPIVHFELPSIFRGFVGNLIEQHYP